MTTARESLVALVGALKFAAGVDVPEAMKAAEAWVGEREKAPDEPVKCPCCEKLVTLCMEHYQLRQPGHPCAMCPKPCQHLTVIDTMPAICAKCGKELL